MMDTTTMAEAAIAGGPATSIGLATDVPSSLPHMVVATTLVGADDNAVEEPKVVMGHPGLNVPGGVSLSDMMGTTHFVLNQAHDVLRREREDINEEWLCLSVWVSMLKKQMTSKKEKAEARQKHLNVMGILLD
jgi:hypothetical protein